tara:strand:+ start:60 stop:374 length:315 start_codon:yes stop_codon:yes gene_type:complete
MENFLFFYPALLFPTIPLMIISFGNRYTAVSSLIRNLHGDFIKEGSSTKDNKIIYEEMINLRIRLRLIRTVRKGSGLAFMSNLVSIFYAIVAILILISILLAWL